VQAVSTTLFDEITHGGDLAPSATKARRSWHWVPTPDKQYDGLLVIRQQGGRGMNCKSTVDTYAVEQQPAPVGFIGRRFYLLKLNDAGAVPDAYEVHVGEREDEGACTCKAGQCRAPCCKHKDALRAAIAAGVFGGVVTREPVM
jgi:hypothetical protein